VLYPLSYRCGRLPAFGERDDKMPDSLAESSGISFLPAWTKSFTRHRLDRQSGFVLESSFAFAS
jgi:hypothetical protein